MELLPEILWLSFPKVIQISSQVLSSSLVLMTRGLSLQPDPGFRGKLFRQNANRNCKLLVILIRHGLRPGRIFPIHGPANLINFHRLMTILYVFDWTLFSIWFLSWGEFRAWNSMVLTMAVQLYHIFVNFFLCLRPTKNRSPPFE